MTDTTTAAATTDTTTTAAATTAATTTTETAPWHGIADPDAAAYITNKGWTNPADIVKSYQGAEKLIGRDPTTLLTMPRADDPEGMRALFTKLGLPDAPDKYDMRVGLPKEAQLDDNFSKTMQGIFHKANLTGDQAKAVVADYNAFALAQREQATKDYELSVAADKQALTDEWKGGFDRMMNKAQSTAQALGFTPEVIDAIEKEVGYAGTYKLFAAMGAKLGEDGLAPTGKTPGFEGQLTPGEAKQQWESKKLDVNFVSALRDKNHPGHKGAAELQTRLFKVMYPEG